MDKIILYKLIHDQNEKPSLLSVNEYEVCDNIFDEDYGIYIMSHYFHLGDLDNEHLYVIGTNSRQEIVGIINIALGSYNDVHVYHRNIILFLALSGAKGFADYHNHPNNIVCASSDDIVSEAHMTNIANLLEIKHIGSYILGKNDYIKVGDTEKQKIVLD